MIKEKMKKGIHSAISSIKEEKLQPIPLPVNTTELLKGKVALIIGGSGGIGSAIAESFLRNQCKVIIAGTSDSKLADTISRIGDEENLQSVIIDLRDIESLPEKVKIASEIFGHIDIFVNSAGVNSFADFLDASEEEYDRVMDIDLKGFFFMTQAAARYMIENQIKGHILNVSSSSALRPAKTPYHMSKWALRGFTLGAADILLKHGIIVNAIAPGPTATSMLNREEGDSLYKEGQPSGRYALPSEIANIAVLLVSDMGNLIVGDTVYATGGSGLLSLKD